MHCCSVQTYKKKCDALLTMINLSHISS